MKIKTKPSFQKLLNETERTQYTDKDVVASVEPCEPQEIEFFTLGKYVTEVELDQEADKLGFVLAHPYALALYAKKHPDFADEHPVGTHWKDADGRWCFAAFSRWHDERSVLVGRDGSEWLGVWSFAGLRKSSALASSELSDPVSLELSSAIKICKDNGLMVYKPL